ncbi:hypothetical protein MMC25_006989 [Agyrium rufum]|nr:hypothetical protein [Agyrium rufum]
MVSPGPSSPVKKTVEMKEDIEGSYASSASSQQLHNLASGEKGQVHLEDLGLTHVQNQHFQSDDTPQIQCTPAQGVSNITAGFEPHVLGSDDNQVANWDFDTLIDNMDSNVGSWLDDQVALSLFSFPGDSIESPDTNGPITPGGPESPSNNNPNVSGTGSMPDIFLGLDPSMLEAPIYEEKNRSSKSEDVHPFPIEQAGPRMPTLDITEGRAEIPIHYKQSAPPPSQTSSGPASKLIAKSPQLIPDTHTPNRKRSFTSMTTSSLSSNEVSGHSAGRKRSHAVACKRCKEELNKSEGRLAQETINREYWENMANQWRAHAERLKTLLDKAQDPRAGKRRPVGKVLAAGGVANRAGAVDYTEPGTRADVPIELGDDEEEELFAVPAAVANSEKEAGEDGGDGWDAAAMDMFDEVLEQDTSGDS